MILFPQVSQYDQSSSKSVSSLAILCVPSIWIPFFTFIVSTMSNGFLSINLEPQVLRKVKETTKKIKKIPQKFQQRIDEFSSIWRPCTLAYSSGWRTAPTASPVRFGDIFAIVKAIRLKCAWSPALSWELWLCFCSDLFHTFPSIGNWFGNVYIYLSGDFIVFFNQWTRSLVVVGIALALSGVSFSGQQVSGIVDAMREAV